MTDLSILQEEQRTLRNELTQLKTCQLQYFVLSVTGTAAVFGIAATRDGGAWLGIAFLAPLAITLPCWWIFFDKASTITRIVGYYRVVERMIAQHPNCDIEYLGYERALALYRKEDDETKRHEVRNKWFTSNRHKFLQYREQPETSERRSTENYPQKAHKKIRHRYWHINWCTYFALSAFSCGLSFTFLHGGGADPWLYMFPSAGVVVIVVFAVATSKLKSEVTQGDYSYEENHMLWEYIHDKYANNAAERPANPGKPTVE